MDISLHSFILVVGLLVIIFIVIDGIKKMRQAKTDPLVEDDWLDHEGDLADDEPLQFDHLEIDEELLTDHFDLKGQSAAVTEKQTQQWDVADEVEAREDIGEETPASELDEPNHSHANEPVLEEETVSADVQETDETGDILRAQKSDPVFSVLAEDVENESIAADKPQPKKEESKPTATAMKEDGLALTEKAKAAAQSFKQHVQDLKHNRKSEEEKLLAVKQPQKKKEFNSDEPVPMLMDPIELGEEVEPDAPEQHELNLPEFVQQTLSDEAIAKDSIQARRDADELLDEYIDDVVAPQDEVGERLSERTPAEEIFVIHVLKNSEPWLQGIDLEHIFKACDMRFGEMNIFHRFEEPNAQGKIQFSVVNALEPGTFDPNNMGALSTPGISLFMSLPGPENPMAAFDAMSEVALVFARNFRAQLQDESHSVLTPQTLEHYRQRIRDYNRRALKK